MQTDQHADLKPVLGPATQLGFVVRDLDAAVRHWIDVLGIGPFLFLENGTGRPPNPSRFRGEQVSIEMRLAFGFIGDVQLELIQQVNDAPSPYTEFLASGREGLQHLGYWVPDYDEARRRVEQAGYEAELVIPIVGQDQSIVYYKSPSVVGPMLEIVPPRWRKAREAVSERLKSWTGGDPLIRYDTYGDFLTDAKVVFD
ncbi:VOC family protein [Oricola sp.]|uniref:VOC family protein n=1 Tax=Oricola sp. TaxID=1979950 RepID=UPI0025CC4AD2|nr:VOC family protein [Oricola sp.]MCI5074480.1 VOC family protein [Oricola sp.]